MTLKDNNTLFSLVECVSETSTWQFATQTQAFTSARPVRMSRDGPPPSASAGCLRTKTIPTFSRQIIMTKQVSIFKKYFNSLDFPLSGYTYPTLQVLLLFFFLIIIEELDMYRLVFVRHCWH